MQSYKVNIEHYFKEIGQKVRAGSQIELREGDAEQYMVSYPGLLTVALTTTDGQPFMIRKIADAPETPAVEDVAPVEPVVPSPEIQPEAVDAEQAPTDPV